MHLDEGPLDSEQRVQKSDRRVRERPRVDEESIDPGSGINMKKETWSGRTSCIRQSRSRRIDSAALIQDHQFFQQGLQWIPLLCVDIFDAVLLEDSRGKSMQWLNNAFDA